MLLPICLRQRVFCDIASQIAAVGTSYMRTQSLISVPRWRTKLHGEDEDGWLPLDRVEGGRDLETIDQSMSFHVTLGHAMVSPRQCAPGTLTRIRGHGAACVDPSTLLTVFEVLVRRNPRRTKSIQAAGMHCADGD